jgi:predicted AAA+ superfamily ATPase
MVNMKKRTLAQPITELAFGAQKMALVSGPRQCGKTTLAKMLLRGRKQGLYRNWDQLEFRREWTRNPSGIIPQSSGKENALVVFDEIHKDRRWKRNLKGIFDTLTAPCDILVTGSARLGVYMKGSDSLLGRYFSFRLHPFSIRELGGPEAVGPDEALEALFSRSRPRTKSVQERLDAMMAYGPFPEPLLAQDVRRAHLWRRNREELVVREDLRDLSRLPELGRVEMMVSLLPERVGSLFSLASVGRDIEASIHTVKRWLDYLKQLYYLFEVKPYTRSIPRSLRREGKIYLWDYSGIPDKAARFENLVACHLLKACHFWTDTGYGQFDLFYLRNKEKREIDFLIVRDGHPWLPVEVKLNDAEPSENWPWFARFLPCRRGLQLVASSFRKAHTFGDAQILVVGAAEALDRFV